MKLRLRLTLEWFLIGGLTSILIATILYWNGTDAFDNIFYDQLSASNNIEPDNDILIVTIDDKSLNQIGKWPWSRNIHARVIDQLKQYKPRSITLDTLMSEAGIPENDDALANAMRGDIPVLLPLHFVSPGENGQLYDTIMPTDAINQAASAIGHVNLNFDEDGIVRRTTLCFKADVNAPIWPHLMEQVQRANAGPSPAYNEANCENELLTPYAPQGSYSEISYVDILESNIPADMIKGKDVIIGATASGMGDSWPVPNADGGNMTGVEIMANMLTALRSDNFIKPAHDAIIMLLSILPIWILLIIFVRLQPRTTLAGAIISIALILLGSVIALNFGYWIPPGAALIGILFIYPLWGWRRLQAVSDFMENELNDLHAEGELTPFVRKTNRRSDIVGKQTFALSDAIDQIKDLRRFVSDVLADLPDPMVVTDLDGTIKLASDLVEEGFGSSIIDRDIHDIIAKIVHPDHRTNLNAYVNQDGTSQNKQSDMANFVRFMASDGSTFVLRRSNVENENNEHIGYVYYLANITALANAESEREEVLQLLSHDMRAPQSAIIASLQSNIDQNTKRRIEQNARKTIRLAQDFVDMARMTETAFNGEDILFADLVRDVADNLYALSEERKVKIKVEDQTDSGFILAEPDTLSRALTNLFDNAIKFSPENGQINATLRRITIGKTNELSLTISDEGSGISAEIMPQLFTRFATLDSEKRRAKGTGLGLSFVDMVAQRHGGNIRAENRRDNGADFILMIPEAVMQEEEMEEA